MNYSYATNEFNWVIAQTHTVYTMYLVEPTDKI